MALTLDPHAETPRGAIAYPAPFDARVFAAQAVFVSDAVAFALRAKGV